MSRFNLRRWALFSGAAALLIAGVVAITAAVLRGHPADAKAENDAPWIDEGEIHFSDAYAKRAGVTDESVSIDTVAPVITANGTLTYDPRRLALIGARISGRVKRLVTVLGDHVKAGDVLAELESAELGRAQAAVLSARAKAKAAEADAKRERHLADEHISSERDAQLAQASYEAVRAEVLAAEQTVTALGGHEGAAIGVLTLKSPIDGRVVSANVSRGQVLEPSDTIFEIADLTALWLELRIFERDVAMLRAGDDVNLSPMNDETRTIHGEVAHVGDVVDAENRSTTVRVLVDNTAAGLRPGESVVARIHTTRPAKRTLSIPKGALTRIDGKPTVFVMRDKNTVEPRIIQVGSSDPARVAVVKGLTEGEHVVVGGMFALKSEIFR